MNELFLDHEYTECAYCEKEVFSEESLNGCIGCGDLVCDECFNSYYQKCEICVEKK